MPDFGDIDPATGQTNERTGYGALDQYAPSVANGQISPAQWAEYQARRRRDAILGTLSILAATTGLGALGGAFGGGGAAAGSAGGAAGSASGGALAPIAGGAPWAVTPYAGTAMSVPTGAAITGGTVGAGAAGAGAAGATAAGEGAKSYLGLTPRDLMAITGAGIGTVGALTADNPNTNLNTSTTDPQMKELLDLMAGRLRKSEPLHDSILSMANGLLPTQYQKGGGGMR